jgi:transposase-like protein
LKLSQRSPASTSSFSKSRDGLREIVRAVMQEMPEAEMTDALGATKGERTAVRLGNRSGYYNRTLITRLPALRSH